MLRKSGVRSPTSIIKKPSTIVASLKTSSPVSSYSSNYLLLFSTLYYIFSCITLRQILLFLKSSPLTTYQTYVLYCLQYFEMRGQSILLIVAWVAAVTSDDSFTCYWIDGTPVPGLFPCEQTGFTMCCDGRYDLKDECIGNG